MADVPAIAMRPASIINVSDHAPARPLGLAVLDTTAIRELARQRWQPFDRCVRVMEASAQRSPADKTLDA
jgi:hypothetical protein